MAGSKSFIYTGKMRGDPEILLTGVNQHGGTQKYRPKTVKREYCKAQETARFVLIELCFLRGLTLLKRCRCGHKINIKKITYLNR